MTGERQPECLTKGYGRKHGKSIRKMTSNIDKDVFQKDEKVIVSLWDKDTMDEGCLLYTSQLGVALEDGSFFIYGVEEKDKQESGLVNDVKIKQLYPNEESEKEGDNNFGKIVDVLYKIGNANQIVQYDL